MKNPPSYLSVESTKEQSKQGSKGPSVGASHAIWKLGAKSIEKHFESQYIVQVARQISYHLRCVIPG